MNAGVLTLIGVLVAAAIAGCVKWLVERRSGADVSADVAKTLSEADHGVASAADVLVTAISRDYQRIGAELELVRRDITALHAELVDVRSDRDQLVRDLAQAKAENAVLRLRVDHLEAVQATPKHSE